MNGIQTALIDKINKLKCNKDKKLQNNHSFNVPRCNPSEPTAYP